MSQHFDEGGQPLQLGKELGRGGEGAVFEIADPKLCAKIYHQPLSADRADKIRIMAKMHNDHLLGLTSWPLKLVVRNNREPIGLVMPRVVGRKDVHKLYSPKSRRSEFLRADWRFLIRAASNTARAFGVVHDAGCVIGDVNHGSVLVAQDATVSLIDCDSFQVIANGRRFLCEVGVETYTPPELQGKPFKGIVRTPNHDDFGLAVMIFHLLFMGRHPFAGRYLGAGDMPIPKAIAEVRFPYGTRRTEVQMDKPPGAPALSIVGSGLAGLFERAFSRNVISGGRPTAREWISELGLLEKNVRQCRANQAHWHLSSLPSCPWCQMEGATGTILFPLVLQATAGAPTLDIEALWRQMEALGHPGPTPDIPQPNIAPSSAVQPLKRRKAKRAITSIVVGGLFFVGLLIGQAGPLAFAGAIAGFFITRAAMNQSQAIAKFKTAHDEAFDNWKRASEAWNSNAGPATFEAKRSRLVALRQEWQGLPTLRLRRLDQLRIDQRQLQLHRFLDGFEIEKAKIPSIGPGRKSALASEGVETAADITPLTIRIPTFGPATQSKLLAWRSSIEARFVFDPQKPIDPRDIARVEQESLAERKRVEDALRRTFAELQQAKAQVSAARQNMRAQVDAAMAAYIQAKVDFEAVR